MRLRSSSATPLGSALPYAAFRFDKREAIDLLVFQSQSLASAAVAAGRSTGSLRVSWHRALRTLQAQFGRQE
jgi:DNA-directed RNA polymerase specialized sigma24 family protein